jgi:hypothetical protein
MVNNNLRALRIRNYELLPTGFSSVLRTYKGFANHTLGTTCILKRRTSVRITCPEFDCVMSGRESDYFASRLKV